MKQSSKECIKCTKPLNIPECTLYVNSCRSCLLNYQKEIEFAYDEAIWNNEFFIVGKECPKCKIFKSVEEYNNELGNLDNLRARCRECEKAAYVADKERILNVHAQWKAKNLDSLEAQHKSYYRSHKDEILTRNNNNRIEKMMIDPEYCKLYYTIPRRISHAVRSHLEERKLTYDTIHLATTLLGCSLSEYVKYIESLWKPGMTWDNWGLQYIDGPKKWHIDHIKPRISFDLRDPTEGYKTGNYTPVQLECFNYKNTQPLWADENHKKYSKY